MTGATKVSRPKMSNHRGRTWDAGTVILLDGSTAPAHLDTTWGTRFYFQHEDNWYAAPIHKFEAVGYGTSLNFDLRRSRD